MHYYVFLLLLVSPTPSMMTICVCVAIITTSLLLTTAFNRREQKVAIRREREREKGRIASYPNWVDTLMVLLKSTGSLRYRWQKTTMKKVKGDGDQVLRVSWCMCIDLFWRCPDRNDEGKKRTQEEKKIVHSLYNRCCFRTYGWTQTAIKKKAPKREREKKGT